MTRTEREAALAAEPLHVVGAGRKGLATTLDSIRDIWTYRELLLLLTRREIKVRYKDSSAGLLWSLFRPLALLVVYFVAIGKFLGAERSIPDIGVYIFTGLTVWTLFNEVISQSTASILGNAGLVKKIYLPREVFPLASVGSALFHFGMQLLILIAAAFLVGHPPDVGTLGFLPLALSVVLVWSAAIGLITAAINVYLRDMQYIVEITLMVLFWSTPTVYSWELAREALSSSVLETIYLANPVSVAIFAMQRVFWGAGAGSPTPTNLDGRLLVMLATGLVVLWIGQRVFRRLEGNFAQEL